LPTTYFDWIIAAMPHADFLRKFSDAKSKQQKCRQRFKMYTQKQITFWIIFSVWFFFSKPDMQSATKSPTINHSLMTIKLPCAGFVRQSRGKKIQSFIKEKVASSSAFFV
jgi:hypothetical protein